jgi:predicted phosphodiesterase
MLVRMRLGVIADIHGNEVALRAILKDAEQFSVDRWWALGDLVLFGPRPVEVLDLLSALPGIGMLRGNTDRYVLTGQQPAPHATLADAVGSLDLVQRYVAMAAGIAWTRGVLDQAGKLAALASLPTQLRLQLPSGADVLGVHASPGSDDGPGIEPEISEERLEGLLAGCDADIVIGGHTHWITDRIAGGVRTLNPGSAGLPDPPGATGWLLLEDDGDGLVVTQRTVPFDADAVIDDLQGRQHPNTEFTTSILSGKRRRASTRSGS